jgi:hypothetical protein
MGRPPGGARAPNYRVFVSGQLVSLIGTWAQSVAPQGSGTLASPKCGDQPVAGPPA